MTRAACLAALLFLVVGVRSAAAAEVVVGFAAGADRPQARADAGAALAQRLPGGLQVLRAADVPGAVAALRRRPDVRFAEPNRAWRIAATPDDPMYPRQAALAQVRAPEAWDTTTGSAAIPVAVLDTGIDLDHPDLAGNLWTNPGEVVGNGRDDDGDGTVDDVNGVDLVAGDGAPDDDAGGPGTGHGTHVAGTLGAVGDNRVGVAGTAWRTALMSVRVCDATGLCTTARTAAGIAYAATHGARVVNLSIEGAPASEAVTAAMGAAPDVLFVAAAGNESTDAATEYPCATPVANLICVTSSAPNGSRSMFANFGPATVDLAAPGERVVSTLPDGRYGEKNGTSMAAPQVAGAAALLLAARPALDAAQLRSAILTAAAPIPALAGQVATGGRLDIAAALRAPALDTRLLTAPAAATADREPTVAFDTPLPGATFDCRLDGAALPCASPLRLGPLADGPHTFTAAARDAYGDVDATPVTTTFTVDTAGPVLTFGQTPAALARVGLARFTFGFDESPARVTCSIDGGTAFVCGPDYDVVVGDGTHTLTVFASDALGNARAADYSWRVDATAPTVRLQGDPVVDRDAVTVNAETSEPASFTCALDDGPARPCTPPITLTGLAAGRHRYVLTATDRAGNASRPLTVTFAVPGTTASLRDPVRALARALARRPTGRLRYAAATPGELSVAVVRHGRSLAGAATTVRTAGSATLRVRLARGARRAIRRGTLRRARIVARFEPDDGAAVSARRRVRF